jgi:UDP-GlcNAc:undecaprenyl-phosphate GlcNAc-1-phosphate transferase
VSFPFNVYLSAFAAACLTALLAAPVWRKWCLRAGLVDDPGHRKIHDRTVPLAGGLTVLTGMLLPVLAAVVLLWWARTNVSHTQTTGVLRSLRFPVPVDAGSVSALEYGLGRRALELLGIFGGAFGMLLIGLLDDKRDLRPCAKFAGQLLVAALVAASGVRITLFVHNGLFHYAVTILWFLAVINAFNFMDNMNGLCAGLGAIAAWFFALLAASDGQYLVALIAFLTCGALLGFLPHNFPRARAFLGDAGSHLVGYLMAVLAILPHFYTPRHPRHWAVLIPLLVLVLPLFDMVWVVLLRWRMGQPFYIGDTNHLSHRLVRLGLTQTQAVLVIWLAATIVGAVACWQ